MVLIATLTACGATTTGKRTTTPEPRETPVIGTALYCEEGECFEVPTEPCPTEDSTDCVWDANTQGNGEGRSFFDIDGTTHYFEETP